MDLEQYQNCGLSVIIIEAIYQLNYFVSQKLIFMYLWSKQSYEMCSINEPTFAALTQSRWHTVFDYPSVITVVRVMVGKLPTSFAGHLEWQRLNFSVDHLNMCRPMCIKLTPFAGLLGKVEMGPIILSATQLTCYTWWRFGRCQLPLNISRKNCSTLDDGIRTWVKLKLHRSF